MTRLFRILISVPLWIAQVPCIALDSLFGTTFYGLPSWSFWFRAGRLLVSYIIWALNPATRPIMDVLSNKARESTGRLKASQRASLVRVPSCPEKLFGDALCENMSPEECPCFWQWLPSMSSPLVDETPIPERRVTMYFVGGGMVQGHPIMNPLPWETMKVTNIPIFGVNFRKCVTSETAFPAALQDGVAAFFYLLDQGFLPKNISMMGDSGGAGIVITLILYLCRHNLTLPDSVILVSPFVDLVGDFMGDERLLALEAMNPEMLSMVSYQYTENRPDLRGTLLSPSLNKLPAGYSFEGFPPTMVVWGDSEIFERGIVDFVAILQGAGVEVERVIGKDQLHDYPCYTRDRNADGFYGRASSFLAGDLKSSGL